MPLQFRPHHFLCALGFRGKGYSDRFVENFQTLVDQLRGPQGDQVQIKVVSQTDSICEPCPHKRDRSCAEQVKIQTLDEAHLSALGLKVGQHLNWGEVKVRIKERLSVERFHRICQNCSWKAMGVCEAALVEHLDETRT